MLTDDEKLDLILSEMQGMKTEMQELKRRVTSIELHLENDTDKNIQLLAENLKSRHITDGFLLCTFIN